MEIFMYKAMKEKDFFLALSYMVGIHNHFIDTLVLFLSLQARHTTTWGRQSSKNFEVSVR